MKLELMVGGMTCGGCEIHVEKSISEIPYITKVKAYHQTGRLLIETDETIDINDPGILTSIEEKIIDGGYKFLGKYVKKTEGFSIKQWVGVVIILAAIYLVVKETGILTRLPVIESSMGYGLIFIIGLLTSVHCIGMCGGINLSVSLSGNKKKKSIKPALLYNAGRVVSYTVVGGIVGALGSVISITGSMQGIIVGIAGFFMILMGIKMLGFLPIIDKIIPKLPKSFTSKIIGKGSGKGPFIVGILNGFMPCGPLQSVQIYALGTGSAVTGAISMFLFSLGTVPLMLGFGSITAILSSKFQGRILKISALLVLMLGSGMVIRGMNLNGVSLMGINSFNVNSKNVQIAKITGDKQFVKTTMHGDEYEPFIVQAGIPVVWTIFADENDLNGCNNPLTVPKYGIRFEMVPGENIIEFTPPSEPGAITYTCWMGMITSGITVVEDLNKIDDSLLSDAAALAENSEGGCGGGCCSTGSETTKSNDTLTLSLPKIDTTVVGIANKKDDKQVIEISINGNGFEPSIIVMERGIETTWVFNGVELNEKNYRLIFPVYGNRGLEVLDGENSLKLVPQVDFAYYSWKQDFGGYVKVVDDINSVDTKEIKALVNSFNESNSSF